MHRRKHSNISIKTTLVIHRYYKKSYLFFLKRGAVAGEHAAMWFKQIAASSILHKI